MFNKDVLIDGAILLALSATLIAAVFFTTKILVYMWGIYGHC